MTASNKNFETARSRKFRAGVLCREDERTIDHVEEFGCSVVNVARSEHSLGWAYTVGIFDVCAKPEIITVGLLPKTAHSALNGAAQLLRSGLDLTERRWSDLIGEVECEFRPVDLKWIRHLMNWSVWHNGDDNFPVLQAIYPDLKNRFPWDDGFDETFVQPLLQPTAPMTRVENDFWASADPKSCLHLEIL